MIRGWLLAASLNDCNQLTFIPNLVLKAAQSDQLSRRIRIKQFRSFVWQGLQAIIDQYERNIIKLLLFISLHKLVGLVWN